MPIVEVLEEKPRQKRFHATLRLIRRPNAEGKYEPTPLEIEEGQAYKQFTINPNAENKDRWERLYWRVWAEQGSISITRCPWCYTVRFGQHFQDPCLVCGTVREIGE